MACKCNKKGMRNTGTRSMVRNGPIVRTQSQTRPQQPSNNTIRSQSASTPRPNGLSAQRRKDDKIKRDIVKNKFGR